MSPGDVFFSTFTPSLNALLVDALAAAYETACEHHVPKSGSTEQMFGFNLYGFAVHELATAAKGSGDALRLKSRQPTFRLLAGDYEIACHRVGRHASDDIDGCFPNNEGAVQEMHEVQLWLNGVDLGLEKARKIVLAHLGSDEDGFQAAYLCFPGATAKQKISSWAYSHPLWVKEQSATRTSANAAPLPDEHIEEAKPRRRPKKDEGHGQHGAE